MSPIDLKNSLEILQGRFNDLKRRVNEIAKKAAKRRDDLLAEHTRKEHFGSE